MEDRVLITGIAGLLGSNLAHHLRDKHPDIEVLGIDDFSGGFERNIPADTYVAEFDLRDQAKVDRFMRDARCDTVYHLAAYAAEGLSPFMRNYCYQQNLLPAANLITAAIKYDVRRFVFTSSMAVYGRGNPPFDEADQPNPIDPYGLAKHAVERDLACACEMHSLPYTIIRPHNVYGPRQNIWDRYRNVLGIWTWRYLHQFPLVIYGDGLQQRAFSYIGDCVEPLWQASRRPEAAGQIINLGGKFPFSIHQACEIFGDVTGYHHVEHRPARHEVKQAWCTTEKSERLLGYQEKTTLHQGLEAMIEWARRQPSRGIQTWAHYELKKPDWLPSDLPDQVIQPRG